MLIGFTSLCPRLPQATAAGYIVGWTFDLNAMVHGGKRQAPRTQEDRAAE